MPKPHRDTDRSASMARTTVICVTTELKAQRGLLTRALGQAIEGRSQNDIENIRDALGKLYEAIDTLELVG